jgi:ribosomal-protein-alanine N-acetyltransferase
LPDRQGAEANIRATSDWNTIEDEIATPFVLLLRGIAENGPVQYRLYHPADFAQLYGIEEICFQPPVRFSRRYLRQIIERSNSVTWVADQEGSVAGFSVVGFTTEADRTFAYIQTIEVAAAHRNQGIGTELMRRMEDSAGAAGAIVIWLHVDAANEAAIRLYQAHGYRHQGRQEHYYDRGRAADVYVKSLQVRASGQT